MAPPAKFAWSTLKRATTGLEFRLSRKTTCATEFAANLSPSQCGSENKWRTILWSLIVTYSATFSILSIARHHAFYSLEDVGAFTQMLWATLRGKLFYTDLPGLGRFAFVPHNYLGDHFSPLLFLLIPVYAVWPEPEVLLVMQSMMLGLAALPLYMIVQERFGDRYLSLAFSIAWLISPYIWQSNIADFHLDTFEPLFIFSACYYRLKKRAAPYTIAILLLLFCKDDTFIYAIGVGIFALASLKEVRTGLYTIVLSLLWGALSFKVFMPLFGGGFAYADHYAQFGGSVAGILKTFLVDPQRIIAHLLERQVTIFWIFFTVGFLPLFSLIGLVLVAPPALEKLLTNSPHINSFSWYYAAPVLPFFFIASLIATGNITRLMRTAHGQRMALRLIGGLMIVAGIVGGSQLGFGLLGGFKVTMPAPVISKDVWIWVTTRDARIRRLLKSIPASASVSTSPYIVSHVAKRFEIRVYPYRPLDRDVILLDVYGEKYPSNLTEYRCAIADILAGGEYGVVEYLDGFLYLRRGFDASRNAAVAREVASIVEADEMHARNVEEVVDFDAGNRLAMFFGGKRESDGLIYGPYVTLPPGDYELAFRMKIRRRTLANVARIEVSTDEGRTILSERTIGGSEFQAEGTYEEFRLDVHTEEAVENVEFRVQLYERKGIWIDRINVYPKRPDLRVTVSPCG